MQQRTSYSLTPHLLPGCNCKLWYVFLHKTITRHIPDKEAIPGCTQRQFLLIKSLPQLRRTHRDDVLRDKIWNVRFDGVDQPVGEDGLSGGDEDRAGDCLEEEDDGRDAGDVFGFGRRLRNNNRDLG